MSGKARRIIDIVLDEESVARRSPEVEHERDPDLPEIRCKAKKPKVRMTAEIGF